MKIQIEIYNSNSIEIKVGEDKYYISMDKFFDLIAMQKRKEVRNNIYPSIYGTSEFKEFQEKHPELSVWYSKY